jgi:hypothetical protein
VTALKKLLAFTDWRLRSYFAFLGNEERWANGASLVSMIIAVFVLMASALYALEVFLGRRLALPSLGIWLTASFALSYLVLTILSRLLREDGIWSSKPIYDFDDCPAFQRAIGSVLVIVLFGAIASVYVLLANMTSHLPR